METYAEKRHYLALLTITSAILCFLGLETTGLVSGDETRVAGISAEMYFESSYIIPKLNDRPFLEYPGLFYYFQTLCFHIFGLTAFAAKLPSAIAAFGSGLLLFFFGLKLKFAPCAAFLSAFFLLTGAQFWANAHTGIVDSLLAFFIFLSVYGFYTFLQERSWWGYAWYILGIAGAVMTKGMIGFIMPLAFLGSYMIGRDILKKKFHFTSYIFLGLGCAAGLVPWAVWAYLLYKTAGWEAFHIAFWVNNFGRFLGTQGDHVEPFYYYFQKLPGLFQPWLIFLPFAIWWTARELRKEKSQEALFLHCALVVPFLLLCIASSKRQVYLLPLYAPAALFCGKWVYAIATTEKVRKYLPYGAMVLAGLLTAGGIVFCFFAAGHAVLYPILLTIAACTALVAIIEKKRVMPLLIISFACFYTAMYATVMEQYAREDCLKDMFAFVQTKEAEGYRCYLVSAPERTAGAAYFYMGRNIPVKQANRQDIGKKELWIIRQKKGKFSERFSDFHFIVTPAEYYANPVRKEKT